MQMDIFRIKALSKIVEPFICEYELHHILKNHKEVSKMIDWIVEQINANTFLLSRMGLENVCHENVSAATKLCGYSE